MCQVGLFRQYEQSVAAHQVAAVHSFVALPDLVGLQPVEGRHRIQNLRVSELAVECSL